MKNNFNNKFMPSYLFNSNIKLSYIIFVLKLYKITKVEKYK